MDKKKIEEAVSAKLISREGKKYILCSDALKIAENMNVAPSEVGGVCNEMKIKIMNCQLGCF